MYKNASIHLIFLLVGILLLCVQVPAQATSYTGSLTATDGGLLGTGSWLDKYLLQPGHQADWFAPTISWIITQNDDNTWDYDYTLSVFKNEVSHFILEVSPTFQRSNMWGEDGDFGDIELGNYQSGGANPNMPSGVYGVKFNNTTGTTVNIRFTSNRDPVWGDFYAKDGVTGGIDNTVWNAGFTIPDYDPQSPVHNGSYMGHLLVPDTVPEPCGLAALLVGLTSLTSVCLRRRRD